jgi:hypothetical protein
VVLTDTTLGGQEGGVKKNLSSVLKVPRQCPFVLLLSVKRFIVIHLNVNFWVQTDF